MTPGSLATIVAETVTPTTPMTPQLMATPMTPQPNPMITPRRISLKESLTDCSTAISDTGKHHEEGAELAARTLETPKRSEKPEGERRIPKPRPPTTPKPANRLTAPPQQYTWESGSEYRTSWSAQDPDPVNWKTFPKPPPVPEDWSRVAWETRPVSQPSAASLKSSSSEEQAPITLVRVPPQPPRARSAEQKDSVKKEVVEEKAKGDMRPPTVPLRVIKKGSDTTIGDRGRKWREEEEKVSRGGNQEENLLQEMRLQKSLLQDSESLISGTEECERNRVALQRIFGKLEQEKLALDRIPREENLSQELGTREKIIREREERIIRKEKELGDAAEKLMEYQKSFLLDSDSLTGRIWALEKNIVALKRALEKLKREKERWEDERTKEDMQDSTSSSRVTTKFSTIDRITAKLSRATQVAEAERMVIKETAEEYVSQRKTYKVFMNRDEGSGKPLGPKREASTGSKT